MSKDLPPKKRDWEPGTFQIGLFIRTPQGSVIEAVWDRAPKVIINGALDLVKNPDGEELTLEVVPIHGIST